MGGQGPGHKSVRAFEARLKNIQKARAARKRAPLPWRSGMESRIIEQLVWQWFLEARGWRLETGENRVPFDYAQGQPYGLSGQANESSGSRRIVARMKDKPWAKLRVARFLGVSHTWVNKLVKRIEADPERMRRKMRAFAPASFEKLERAREETRVQRERGWLRGPIRWRRVKVTLEGKEKRVVAGTRVERGRQRAEVERERARLRQGYGGASVQAGAAPVRFSELPRWAAGSPLPGGAGIAALSLSGPFVPQGKQARGRGPRPVPFAFRRRR